MINAAVLFAPNQPFEIRQVALDAPKPREVRLRVAASGLCHSDWHFANGDLPAAMPIVLGHEAAGIVEAIGEDVRSVAVGDHVVSCALVFCGHCDQCVSARTHTCQDKPKRQEEDSPRISLGERGITQQSGLGAFAEAMLVHENAIVKIDRAMPLDRAALMGCGVLTGFGAVINAARVIPGSKVVVIGAGGVGLNVIQAARFSGARQIVAVDLNPDKAALARQFGATDFVAGGPDALAEVREVTAGGADFAFEVIGLPETIAQGIQMMAPNGLMTIVGAAKAGATIPVPGIGLIFNEWRVQGTFFGGSPFTRDIPRLVRLYMDRRIELDALITERIELADINRGFLDMLAGHGARSVITFDDVLADAAARA